MPACPEMTHPRTPRTARDPLAGRPTAHRGRIRSAHERKEEVDGRPSPLDTRPCQG
jgi:hypothetical protein